MELQDWGLTWPELSEEVVIGVKEWRLQNPAATFTEIEKELDPVSGTGQALRLAKLRGRMLQDTALASSSRDWSRNEPGERPVCPDCGHELASSGKRERRLQTLEGQEVPLEREYGVCPACGGKFFPSG